MATKAKKKAVKNKKKTAKKPAPAPKFLNGVDGYLVVWRHTLDDIPVALFASRSEAREFAENTSFRAGYEVAEKFGIDCSTPVCFVIYRFVAGRPEEILYVSREDDA